MSAPRKILLRRKEPWLLNSDSEGGWRVEFAETGSGLLPGLGLRVTRPLRRPGGDFPAIQHPNPPTPRLVGADPDSPSGKNLGSASKEATHTWYQPAR